MFCRNCGVKLPEDAKFCPACGQEVQQPQEQIRQSYPQPQSGYQQAQQLRQSYAQPPVYQPPENPYGQSFSPQQPAQGMKWHKFLVYFALWAGALGYLVYGIVCLTGAQYGSQRDLVYAYIPEMKAPDTVYGIVMLGTAVFSVITALSLLRFKAAGPKNLTMLYLIEMVGVVVYAAWSLSVLSRYGGDTSRIVASLVSSLVGGLLGILINKIYYGKRAHLFVN